MVRAPQNQKYVSRNQRGKLSRVPVTALCSVEVLSEPVDMTPWCCAHRWEDEGNKIELTLHRVSTIKFPLPANVFVQGRGKMVRKSNVSLGPWWGETSHPEKRYGAKEASVHNGAALSRAVKLFKISKTKLHNF